jgi:hypothetical protein
MSGVLHFTDAETARRVAACFSKALVSGGYLIVSCGWGNRSEEESFTTAYSAARVYIHSREEIESFFDGLSLVPPGVVPVGYWPGEGQASPWDGPTATFLAGVAKKP